MESDNAYAYIGLGHLHYDFKEYQHALDYWEKMLELHPYDADIRVYTSLGNCHRKLKTFKKGLMYFDKALSMETNNFYALFGLADCYRGLNDQEKSLKYWLKILDLDSKNKVILTRVGDAYRGLAVYDQAEIYYKKALNIEFDIYAILGLALINKSVGKYEEAVTSLTNLIQNDPKNHRLYTETAECFLKMNRRDKALEILTEFQKQGIRNQHVLEMIEYLKQRR
jgi:predicted Zn-dependent protease